MTVPRVFAGAASGIVATVASHRRPRRTTLQNSVTAEEQIDDTNAGEAAHTAANTAYSQADASASMTPDKFPEVNDAAIPSPS